MPTEFISDMGPKSALIASRPLIKFYSAVIVIYCQGHVCPVFMFVMAEMPNRNN